MTFVGAALAQPLGLPLGALAERVRAALSSAKISCKIGDSVWECQRAPEQVAGAAGLRLEFEKDRLVRAELNIDPGAKTYPAYRGRYIELKRELTRKHGEPATSLEYVESSYVLADDEYNGIAAGKGEFTSTWKREGVEAKLSLHGEKQQVRLTLSYVLH